MISKHDFTIYDLKSSHSNITYTISLSIPKLENLAAKSLYNMQLDINSNKGNKYSYYFE